MLNRIPELKESPSQTAGPYVHIGLTPNFAEIIGTYEADLGVSLVTPETKGERIVISGRILDGAGSPLTDAVIELWQADAEGRYAQKLVPEQGRVPNFLGWGRQATNADGTYRFETIKPGRVAGPDGKPMAPHVTLWIVARGINIGLHTRLYFADEAEANAEDVVLNKIPDPRRRKTLVAAHSQAGGMPFYTLDIRVQGEDETVFFDI
jgi:protocatechuate 3,4-dioxygenase, alpha subunit